MTRFQVSNSRPLALQALEMVSTSVSQVAGAQRTAYPLGRSASRETSSSASLVTSAHFSAACLARLVRVGLACSFATFACTFLMAFLPLGLPVAAQSRATAVIRITVIGEDQKPLAGVTIEGRSATALLCKAITDAQGHATLSGCGAALELRLTASLEHYVSASSTVSVENQSLLEIVLSKATSAQQTVVVQGNSQNPLTESKSSESKLPMEDAKVGPLRPATLVDTLPLVPGVIRTPDGRVQVTGLDEEHSSLVVNSININDPATGDFGLSIPVDSVDILKVMQSPYLAQYGSFTAGVVSAETRRGGDKWDYSLNDPLPDFRIRSGHLMGVKDASPRLNFSGPLIANRLYVLEGTEYLMSKDSVRTLPFPVNEIRSTAVNSFTQTDVLLGARNSITSTVHFAPHSVRYATLNYFDPQPVTPNADYQEITGTISERFGIRHGVVVSTFAGTRIATNVTGQAEKQMVLSPQGNSGNYFDLQNREATRFQWVETWNPANVDRYGQHAFQIGTVLAHAEDEGQVTAHNVSIEGTSGELLQTISFHGKGKYSLSDLEPAAYAEDHWILNSHLAVDTGIRWESQSLTYTSRFAPRSGFAWKPRKGTSTAIRGGVGVFYDSVPLDTYAFGHYPEQIVTTYDGHGNITDGPRRYLNLTSTASKSKFPWIAQRSKSGNFAPYSVAWNIEVEHAVKDSVQLRVHYLHADAQNQLTLVPQINSAWSALVLDSSGTVQSHQMDFTARIGASALRQFFFSYVRQFARGDITDASSYLGDFPFPVVRSQIQASTRGEIPNRFLVWGTSVLPWEMRLAPQIEYRDGFTWQPIDQLQNYVALASGPQPRYPRYFSADVRVAKDVKVSAHAVRFSVTVRNLTDHVNPLQIHNNAADPLYGTFFGNYGRHYLADFDFLY